MTLKYLRQNAALGHADAEYQLGMIYWTGRYIDGEFIERDQEKAKTLIVSAAAKGHPEAITFFDPLDSIKVLINKEVSKKANERLSLKYAISQAALGHADAEYQLGMIYWTGRYIDGEFIQLDRGKAKTLIVSAAEKGHPEAILFVFLQQKHIECKGNTVEDDGIVYKLAEGLAEEAIKFALKMLFDKLTK